MPAFDDRPIYSGYNAHLKDNARRLRREMTPEERHLWYDFLKPYPVHFYRQRPIAKFFIADFFCPQAKLVIELDGSQHFSEDGQKYDAMRTALIEEYGIQVMRFANREINEHFEGVCILIDQAVQKRTPSL